MVLSLVVPAGVPTDESVVVLVAPLPLEDPPVEPRGVDAVGQALGAGAGVGTGAAVSPGITRVMLDSFPVVVKVEVGHCSA